MSTLKERKHDKLGILDMGKDILKEMLDKITDGLMAAADKCGLERLRILCEQSLAAKQNIQFMKNHRAEATKASGLVGPVPVTGR